MFPITLEEIEQAYAATGLKPVRREWGDAKTCACPMSAVVIKRHDKNAMLAAMNEDYPAAAVGEWLGLTAGTISAFTRGYDGDPPSNEYSIEKREAYELGQLARARFPAGMTADPAP